MSRARDVSNDQANVGGSIAPYVAGKNFLINGNFDFFQRGSFNSQTSSAYTFDRWYGGVGGTVTLTQQTTGVPLGSNYCGRVAYNAASSFCNLYQALESGLVTTLIGRTITVSIKVRRNSSFAANLNLGLDWGTVANSLVSGTWTEFASSSLANASIPTGTTSSDWATISVTATVPTNALGLRVHVYENVAGASGQYWEIAQAQMEIGSIATPFSRAGGSIGGELALCQRYYYRWTSSATYSPALFGSFYTTTQSKLVLITPVTMRTAPSTLDYGGTFRLTDQTNYSDISSMSLVVSTELSLTPQIIATASAASFANYRPAWLTASNSTTAYMGVSAEL